MVAAILKKVKQSLGQGSTTPARVTSTNFDLVKPKKAGITNTIGRAELAAIAAAMTSRSYSCCHRQPYLTLPN